jgi:hypothetical protein
MAIDFHSRPARFILVRQAFLVNIDAELRSPTKTASCRESASIPHPILDMPLPLEGDQRPEPLRMTPRQEEVIATLRKQHPDPERVCRMFEGALHALANLSNPDRLAQAGNSLRELLEKFLDEEGVKMTGGDIFNQRNEIRKRFDTCAAAEFADEKYKDKPISSALADILKRLKKYLKDSKTPSRSDQTATALAGTHPLHSFTSEERKDHIHKGISLCAITFQNFAHHKTPTGEDGEALFAETLDALQTLLLYHFNPPMSEAMHAIKQVARTAPSEINNVSGILQGIRNDGAVYEFFFKELISPDWVSVLEREGFFTKPPDIRNVGDGSINFTVWWPLIYLLKVAPQVPDLAASICARVPVTENPRPYFEIIRIALAIPDHAISIKLKDKLIHYADFPNHWLGGEFGPVLAYWAEGNAEAQAAALDLAGHLIAFRVDSNHDPDVEGYHTSSVKPAFRQNQYADILHKGIRPLVDKTPLATAQVLMTNLAAMIDLRHSESADESRAEDDDLSTAWCKRIDVSYDDYVDEAEELVHALTYACEKSCQVNPVTALRNDSLLAGQRWKIFRRIRYHLYWRFPTLFKTQTQDALVRFQGYADQDYLFEFAQLSRAAWDALGTELLSIGQLTPIFEQILAGPNVEELHDNPHYTAEGIIARRDYVQRHHLWPFEQVLFGPYLDRFNELISGHAVSIDDYLGWGGRPQVHEIVTQSPVAEVDLAARTDDELVDLLNTWTQTDPPDYEMWVRRDREGLARAFAMAVAKDPARFAAWGEKWGAITRPIYLRKALEEVSKMILTDRHDHVGGWLTLAERIVSVTLPPINAPAAPDEENDARSDWQWARTVVVSFIKACLDTKTGVAAQWRPRIWSVLRFICCDTDARLDDSQTPPSSELISIAINCTRGPALEALIAYAAWSRKHGESPLSKSEDEIGLVLDQRFAGDPPLTWPERGLLASDIHHLYWVSPTWVERNIENLIDQRDVTRWLACFKAFIHYGHIRTAIFPVLKSQYVFGLNHLDDLRRGSTEKQKLVAPMGFHFALLFLWGSFPYAGDESLLASYYERTTTEEKSDLMTRFGQSIHHAKVLDDPMPERAMQFFEERLNVASAEPTEGVKEFQSVNSWIQSKTLPATWRLAMLRRVLLLRPSSEDLSYLTGFLVECLSDHLAPVMECFALLTELGASQPYFYVQPNEGKAILRAGLASSDEAIKAWAKAAQNSLLAARRFEFLNPDGD